MFPHKEFKYYFFGLRAGLANLFGNGLQLGMKKTAGKLMQPINSLTRFPEYYWFDRAISGYLAQSSSRGPGKILDVGSPKAFGLYLGKSVPADITLTDISELNVEEYKVMWHALQAKAKGSVGFALQDARELQFPDQVFDVVYSMSVLEHIEGQDGDAKAIRELLRVLKPGGLLVISLPFGNKYIEQQRVGFAGAARKTGDQQSYFFQRIYDREALQRRILGQLTDLDELKLITVQRRRAWIQRGLGALGENLRGVLGGLNPFLSAAVNRSRNGIDDAFATRYAEFHQAQDVYGDVIVSGLKR